MSTIRLYVDFAAQSLNKYGEELCGDKVEFVRGEDFSLMVLADGLGSGVKANILSTLTAKIIATMLSGGATLQEAIETIACTLPVCSWRGIAYSTFTVIHIRDNNVVSIAEFDNPFLLYMKKGVITDINRQETVIDDKKIYLSEIACEADDCLISFSDGVVHAGIGSLMDLGWQYDNIVKHIKDTVDYRMSPQVITQKILDAVSVLYMGKCGDDSTVCTLKLRKNCPAVIMVGPPADSAQDQAVVDRLLSCEGLKVVCGGTTSQIVSRLTGREIEVALNYADPSVPPTAVIEGIDLVTEGVLTLGKTVDIVKRYLSGEEGSTQLLRQADGASRLAKVLLEDSTQVTFMVGRALNPAHQNPSLPLSLSLKLGIINELADLLRQSGKRVQVDLY